MIRFVMNPPCWLLVAISVLVPWQISHVLRDPTCGLPPKPIGDGPDYECIGYSLSIGQGYAFTWDDHQWQHPYRLVNQGKDYVHLHREALTGYTTSRPPFFPWLISIVYRVIPRNEMAFTTIRLISAVSIGLAGAMGVWIATTITVRIFPLNGLPVFISGTSSMGLALLDRTIRTYATDFLSEPLAMLATTLFCVFAVGFSNSRRPELRALWMGLIFGWMILIRSMFVFWLPGIAILVLLASYISANSKSDIPQEVKPSSSFRRSVGIAGLFLVSVFLVISPWCYRNVVMLNRFMPLGTQGVSALLGGYCEESIQLAGNWSPEPELRLRAMVEQSADWKDLSSLEKETRIADAASLALREWIFAHKSDLPQLALMRLKSHWGPFTGTSLLWRIGMLCGVIALCLFRRAEGWWLIGMPIVSSVVVMCLYETGGRFLVPLYGLLYGIAGIGVGACVGVGVGIARIRLEKV